MILFKRGRVQRPHQYISPSGDAYKLYIDMLSENHLLIAGATGSGKSVIINGLVYTILYSIPGKRAGGKQLILIDPKRVELSIYKPLPHTISYASDPDAMTAALYQAMTICENRYKSMQAAGARIYAGGDIYIIIDEFADLILTQGRTVKPLIQRLAQIGRAAKMHIILATQTPISKVIPTEIKCNFDARAGLRTRSRQDSINIIGRPGLETLPRYGKAIYYNADGETLYNVPMIPEKELQARVAFWTRQK